MTERQRRIVVITPEGHESEIPFEYSDRGLIMRLPSLADMQRIVGGPIELVRVLRQDQPGHVFTYLIANETGWLNKLPRNQKATDLYLANVRRQFPDSSNPSLEARRAYRERMEALGAVVIDDVVPDYDHSDPYIAGTVIWFDGFTCDELLEAGL